MNKRPPEDATRTAHASSGGQRHHGVVTTPVYHASTVRFRNVTALRDERNTEVTYGRKGTPTTFAVQEAIAELEGADGCIVFPSGVSAITTALIALLDSGDHLLMVDTAYKPTRDFSDKLLSTMGVETTYYGAGEDIRYYLRPNTRAVFLESPGSQTMEMLDIPTIVEAAHSHGASTIIDNTWATPLYCKPLNMGVDVCIHSVTKYISGHSDLMMGAVSANGKVLERIRTNASQLGLCTAPDDCYLAMRGLRTLAARLERHSRTAHTLATWLADRPEVGRVLYPALPDAPGHDIWKRNYTGATGLLSVLLEPVPDAQVVAMLDGFRYFGLGYSWGGFESLALPIPKQARPHTPWPGDGPIVRFHVGLEDPDDLLADLKAGFTRLNGADGLHGRSSS